MTTNGVATARDLALDLPTELGMCADMLANVRDEHDVDDVVARLRAVTRALRPND